MESKPTFFDIAVFYGDSFCRGELTFEILVTNTVCRKILVSVYAYYVHKGELLEITSLPPGELERFKEITIEFASALNTDEKNSYIKSLYILEFIIGKYCYSRFFT